MVFFLTVYVATLHELKKMPTEESCTQGSENTTTDDSTSQG